MKKKSFIFLVLGLAVLQLGCHKDSSSGTCTDGTQNQDETDVDCGGVCSPCQVTATTAKSFSHVTFNSAKEFFSLDGNSNSTLDSNQAKLVGSTIDLTYTYDGGYSARGFLDAVTRSSGAYYWSSMFKTSWTSGSKQLLYYKTTYHDFDGALFNAVKNNQSLIGVYFSDTSAVHITTHSIWPTGACFGGRNATVGYSQYSIIGFKRSDGKRGFMKVVDPLSPINSETVVDIVIER